MCTTCGSKYRRNFARSFARQAEETIPTQSRKVRSFRGRPSYSRVPRNIPEDEKVSEEALPVVEDVIKNLEPTE